MTTVDPSNENSNSFVDQTLGFWSSHPKWILQRSRWLWWLSSVPLAITVIGFLVFGFVYGPNTNWLDQTQQILKILMVVGSCSIAFGLTWTLCSGLAQKAARRGSGMHFEFNQLNGQNVAYGMVGVFLACLGPGIVIASSELPFLSRVCLYLLTCLPVLTITILAFPSSPAKSNRFLKLIRAAASVTELLVVIAGLGIVLTLIHDIGVMTDNETLSGTLSYLLPSYAGWRTLFLGLLVFTPIVYTMLVLRRKLQLSGEQPIDHESGKSESTDGFITRFFKRLFGSKKVVNIKSPDRGRHQEMLGGCMERLQVADGAIHEMPSSTPRYRQKHQLLTGGFVPTESQSVAITKFMELYDGVNQQSELGSSDRNIDLIVHGPRHSGKSSVLMACIVDAVVRRGQNVVVLLSDWSESGAFLKWLAEHFEFLHLRRYVAIEVLSEKHVTEWSGQQEPFVPQVLLATPDAFQNLIYDSRTEDVRNVARLYSAIFVDDFDRFDDVKRSHIPFLLDKHRWLFESDFVTFQAVLTCSRLADAGVKIVGSRIATSSLNLEDQCVGLQRLPLPSVHLAETRVDFGRDVLDELDDLANEFNVPFLLAEIGKLGQLKTEIHNPTGKPVRKFDVMMVQGRLDEAGLVELRKMFANEGATIFCHGWKFDPKIIPVSADRNSSAFRAAHFQNLAPFLTRRSPVHVDVAKRFGVNPENSLVDQSNSDDKHAPTLFWDRRQSWIEEDEPTAFAALATPNNAAQKISVRLFPNPSFALAYQRKASEIYVQQSDGALRNEEDIQQRRAIWQDDSGSNLKIEFDLAHSRKFKVVSEDGQIFVPRSISKANGHYVIKAESTTQKALAHARVIPEYHLQWSMTEEQNLRFSEEPIFVPEGSAGDKLPFFFANFESGPESPLRAECRINSLFTPDEQQSPLRNIRFSFDANISVLVFKPKFRADKSHHLIKHLLGDWSTTSDDFRRAISLGFAETANEYLPGFLTFGFPLAFHVDQRLGALLVWIVQPKTGGLTAGNVLQRLLSATRDRRTLLVDFIRCLRDVENELDPSVILRLRAMLDFQAAPAKTGQAAEEINQTLANLGIAK